MTDREGLRWVLQSYNLKAALAKTHICVGEHTYLGSSTRCKLRYVGVLLELHACGATDELYGAACVLAVLNEKVHITLFEDI